MNTKQEDAPGLGLSPDGCRNVFSLDALSLVPRMAAPWLNKKNLGMYLTLESSRAIYVLNMNDTDKFETYDRSIDQSIKC
jgi:hypothetical protein